METFTTALLLVTLLIPNVLADFDYKAGAPGAGDVLVVDCTYDRMGVRGVASTFTLTFASKFFTPGTTFTALDVKNLKTDFRANIFKDEGGINSNFVKFSMVTFMDHGAKFQYKLWAKVTSPNPMKITGNCVKEQGR